MPKTAVNKKLSEQAATSPDQPMIAKLSLADQLARSLMAQISTGELRQGAQLPTEAELCRLHGVSRVTVRRALDFLHKNSMISRIAGKGTYVSGKSDIIGWKLDSVQDLVQFTTDTRTEHPKVLKWSIVRPIAAAREFLGVGNEKTYFLLQTRYVADKPIYFVEVHIPLSIGQLITVEALKHRTPLELFERQLGLPPQRVIEELSAGPAPKLCAGPLGIAVGDPTVLQTLKFYGPGGPLQYVRLWWPAKLFKRRNELVRR